MGKKISMIKKETRNKIFLIVLIASAIFIAGCWSDKGLVKDEISVYGSSDAPYEILVGKNRLSTEPLEWTNRGIELRNNGQKAITDDILAKWDTTLVPDGDYTIRLFSGSSFEDLLYVTVDNAWLYPSEGEEIEIYSDGYEDGCNKMEDCEPGEESVIGIYGRATGTEFDGYTIEWSQNSIEWKSDGIELENDGKNKLEEDAGLLALWDSSVLKYRGRYFIKLTINNKGEEGGWTNEDVKEVYITGDNLMVSYPSQIKNEGKEDLEGYLLIKVQKKSEEEFTDYETIIDDLEGEPRKVLRQGGMLDLSNVFNKVNYSIEEPGKYKIYAALLDGSGKVIPSAEGELLENSYEFEVLDSSKPEEVINECIDGTKPNDCSEARPMFCTQNLELVNRCQSCGCYYGQSCQNDGTCKGEIIVSYFDYYSIDPYDVDLYNIPLTLKRTNYGEINFVETIDFSSFNNGKEVLEKLEENVKIEQGEVSVDSQAMPMLKKNAIIIFYNIDYEPKIIVDGKPCSEDTCTDVSYDPELKKVAVKVKHFTKYEIQKANECGNMHCEEGETASDCPSDCSNPFPKKYNLTKSQFDRGYTRELGVKDEIKFNVKNEAHFITFKSITSDTVKIEVSSDPEIIKLKEGEEKKIEVTGDEFYDLFVKLNNILEDNKVIITIKSIHESLTPSDEECIPNWECKWGNCLAGKQIKKCIDMNECGTDEGKPEGEQRNCVIGKRKGKSERDGNFNILLFVLGSVTVVILFIIFIAIIVLKRKKSEQQY